MDRQNKDKSSNNIINLDPNKRRTRSTTFKRAGAKKTSKSDKKAGTSGKPTWMAYAQLILFLALLAYMMQQCGR